MSTSGRDLKAASVLAEEPHVLLTRFGHRALARLVPEPCDAIASTTFGDREPDR